MICWETGLPLPYGIACLHDLEARVRATNETVGQGIPNYFGLQRFGATRPVTHLVGECILRGDFEQAVVTYIGKEFPGEPEHVRAVRSAFFTTRDIQAALQDLPPQMSFERAMLHYLYQHPDDYSGALLGIAAKTAVNVCFSIPVVPVQLCPEPAVR